MSDKGIRTGSLVAAIVLLGLAPASEAYAIPAFARAYDVPCSSCHSQITRRHQFGDAFRKAGYHWPQAAEESSAEMEYTELRGTAALDGWLPTTVPFAVEGTMSFSHNTDPDVDPFTASNPSILVLMGAAFGDHASVFGTWTGSGPPQEFYVHVARIADLPELNLRVGLMEQSSTIFKSNDNLIARYLHGSSAISGHVVSAPRTGFELNGILSFLGDRTFYAAGVVQNSDLGTHWDGYYRLEQKIGGMNLLGREPEIDLFAEESFWDDVYATIATWGYIGQVSDIAGTATHDVQRYGLETMAYVHGFTLQAGAMLGLDRDLVNARDVTSLSWFVEAQYPITSWLSVLYMYQYQDSTDLQREVQLHDAGFVGLVTENIRTRLKATFSDDGTRNDTVELQLLAAF